MCNSSSSVLVPNRTSPSLLQTFVVDTLLNFPLPFNIHVILTYTNTSRVQAFGRLLVRSEIKMYNVFQLTKSIGNNETIKTSEAGITDINLLTIIVQCRHKSSQNPYKINKTDTVRAITISRKSKTSSIMASGADFKKNLIYYRGTQWICSSKYLFFRHIFAGWEMWKK